MEENSGLKLGMVGAKNDSGVSAFRLPTMRDCLFMSSPLLSRFFGIKISYGEKELKSKVAGVDVLPGSFFFITSEAIQDVGFLDENTFLYFEESILANKLHRKGYSNYLLIDVKYSHLNKGPTRNIFFFKRMLFLRKSSIYYLSKSLNYNKILILLYSAASLLVILGYQIHFEIKKLVHRFRKA